MDLYETYPYLKFAHFTANQAILEAFTGKNRVHVIDFSMKQGLQWPALMQALVLRHGGPPAFRLTGIGPPQPDNTDALQQVGLELAQLAKTINIQFEYRGFIANSLADIDASMLDIRPNEIEAVAVNSVFELHPLMLARRPGAVDKVLSSIKAMNPKIVTIIEQDQIMSEVYLGRQVSDVVACEGMDRETLTQWRGKMESAGFAPVHLGSNAFKQASMLLALFGGGDDGYMVEENDGCLMLCWHTRPLIATSAWKLSSNTDPTTQ